MDCRYVTTAGGPALASTTEPSSAMLLVDVLLCGRLDIACRPHRLRQGTMAREQSRVLTRRAVCPQGHRRRTRKVQCRLEREMLGTGRVCSRIRPRGGAT